MVQRQFGQISGNFPKCRASASAVRRLATQMVGAGHKLGWLALAYHAREWNAESSLPQHIEMSAHDNRDPARFEWRDRPIAQGNVSELIARLQQQVHSVYTYFAHVSAYAARA